MSRADRLERMDVQRVALETEYTELLVAALRRTAAGSWGLFDHNQSKSDRKSWEPTVAELCELGAQIDQIRSTLELERFGLHEQFEAARGPVPSTAPGEPKQAKAWLERLGESL